MKTLRVKLNSGPTPDFVDVEVEATLAEAKTREMAKDGFWVDHPAGKTLYPPSSIACIVILPE